MLLQGLTIGVLLALAGFIGYAMGYRDGFRHGELTERATTEAKAKKLGLDDVLRIAMGQKSKAMPKEKPSDT